MFSIFRYFSEINLSANLLILFGVHAGMCWNYMRMRVDEDE